MEWLRVVDLAEYAPNMRGSGVHGGLMIYEGRFTSELLATLLSISPGKTLLRRHLTTHFNQILGREVVQRKREIENTSGFIPLTLTARLKVISIILKYEMIENQNVAYHKVLSYIFTKV